MPADIDNPYELAGDIEQTVTASTSTTEIDFSAGHHVQIDLEADTELQGTNIEDGGFYVFEFVQDGTGGHFVTLDSADYEIDGDGPFEINLTANATTIWFGYAINSSKIRLTRDWSRFVKWTRSTLNTVSRLGGAHFDGVTSGMRAYSTPSSYTVGQNSLTFRIRLRIPDSAVTAGVVALASSNTSAFQPRSLRVAFLSSGECIFDLRGATTNDFNRSFVSDFFTTYAGRVVDMFFIRDASVPEPRLYIDGELIQLTTSDGGSVPGWDGLITNTHYVLGISTASQQFSGPMFDAQVFNLALSEADVLAIHRHGLPFDLSQAVVTTLTSGTLVPGRRYRIVSYVASDDFTNVGAASNTTGVEFVATGATPTAWTNSSQLRRIGAVIDLDLSNGRNGRFFPDRSGNRFHCEGQAGVYSLVDRGDRPQSRSYSASLDMDFTNGPEKQIIGQLTGNLTLTGSNYRIGAEKTLYLSSDGSSRTFTFPSGWVFVGAAKPASIAANKSAKLILYCTTTAESGVRANYLVQP